ncbi:type II toxin-antitoxin system Phd/YefM family antitoxin [Methylomonas sp. YC3]
MQTVNIRKAKTHLSRLVEQAAKGEPFLIAKAGKPLVPPQYSTRWPHYPPTL